MNLFIKISRFDLTSYRKEFLECLKHNSENHYISSIIVYTDEVNHKIQNVPKVKVVFKKELLSDTDIINISKSSLFDKIILSNPFTKFNNDLYKITTGELQDFVLVNPNYYIYSKDITVSSRSKNEPFFSKPSKNISLNCESVKLELNNIEQNSNITTLVKKPIYKAKPILSTVRSKKIDVIIVSVNYNDYLVLTLKENIKLFDNITVVTSSADTLCQKICRKYEVNCIVTDVMYENGSTFNKGKAINEGIKSIENPDIILLLDADIIVNSKINLSELSGEVLYTSERIILENYKTYRDYIEYGITKRSKLEGDKGYGFFQLFCINNTFIDKNKVYSEEHDDASYADIEFRDRFNSRQTISNPCLHIGETFRNWKGRITEKFISDIELIEMIEKHTSQCVNKISNRSSDIKPKLAVITTFFNPNNYINIKYNYNKFSKKLKEKCDLFTIELSFDGNFYIEDDNVLRINGNNTNILWQKERMLNILLENIPEEYTNIAWVDCDIIFENENWVNECNEKLQKYKVVQLYEFANRLNENDEVEIKSKGIIKRISEINKIDINLSLGIPGFGWAIRREIIDELKFLDTQIIGGADSLMFYSFFGQKNGAVSNQMNKEWYKHFEIWSDKAYKMIDNSVGFVSGEITHLYHGKMINRKYNNRYKILTEHKFDPSIDLKKDDSGLWIMKNENIVDKLKKYFEDRYEDDNIIELNSYFDKIFVLNLDRRPDKFGLISEKLKILNIKFERFSAIDGMNLEFDNSNFKPGKGMIENKFALGCLLSHFEIIKEAKQKNYKRILIFEDDVLISKDIKAEIQKIRNIKDWKLLYLGSSQYDWNLEFIEDFYLSKKSLGTFAYAIDNSIYDDILNSELYKSVDNLLSEIQKKYYGKCYTFYPNICISDVSKSDIRNDRNQEEHSIKMKWNLLNNYV